MCRSIRRERWLRFPMEEKPSIYENFGVHNLRPVVRLMDGELFDLSNEANYHITLRMKTESGFSTEEAEKERNEMIRPPVRCRIMVVDDMKTNLQMLRGILEPLYDVILMKSGHQALLYLKNIRRRIWC